MGSYLYRRGERGTTERNSYILFTIIYWRGGSQQQQTLFLVKEKRYLRKREKRRSIFTRHLRKRGEEEGGVYPPSKKRRKSYVSSPAGAPKGTSPARRAQPEPSGYFIRKRAPRRSASGKNEPLQKGDGSSSGPHAEKKGREIEVPLLFLLDSL